MGLSVSQEADALLHSVRSLERRERALREALAFIASQENLTFAECSLAEAIISRAKAALNT